MQINLKLDLKEDLKTADRVKQATQKKALAKYEPTWKEVWETGYKTATGKDKKGIYQTKITDPDMKKLQAVKGAIENNEISTGVENLREFTKTKALGLYKVLMEIRRDQIIKDMVANMPDNYVLVDNIIALHDLATTLTGEDMITLDTETTGVEVFGESVAVGMSLTLPRADRHYYIPFRHNLKDGEKQLDPEVVMDSLRFSLEDPNVKKLLHNAKFDFHILRKEGVEVQGLYMDTMVAMHLLNENEMSFALKNLATKYGRYFGFEDKSATYEELFGRCGFENTPLDIGTVYACKDTHLTYKFAMWIMEQFERVPQLKDLYFNIELPITTVCIEMEKNGFLLDVDFAVAYQEELKKEILQLDKELVKWFGDINLNSNQQLQEKLYDEMGLPDISKARKVDKPTLEKLAKDCEGLKILLESRTLTKLLGTYIEPLPSKISDDGRLHGSFNQSATATGRFASNNPNLQNLPYNARKMIVAPDGKLIIGIDYSQIEPRVLSHISGDKDLQYPYLTGQDLYSTLASKVFKVPIEECLDGSKYRKMMKVGLLACMYGTSTFTLAQQLKITQEEAEAFINDFMETYPDVAKFFDDTHDHADEKGFVQTLYGRKRRFIGHQPIAKRYKALEKQIQKITGKKKFNIWEESKVPRDLKMQYWEVAKEYGRVSRQSVNAIIQGSSADIMKIAMIDLYNFLKTKGPEWKLLGTIHDEVLIEIPATATPEEILEIAGIQRDAVKLSVPFKVDIEMSARWGQGVGFNDWVKEGCGYNVFEKSTR